MIREHLTPRPHRGLRVGEELTLASGELAVVMTGHLSATVGGFFDRLLVPSDLVGVEQGPVTTLTALTDAELLVMDFGEVLAGTESVAALKAMLALAEAQVRDLTDRRAELERHLDDFLDADDGGFAAPPYVATHARLVMVVLQDRSLASELPRPLRPIPGFEDRVLLVWTRYPDIGPPDGPNAAYEETSVFVPCIDPGAGGPGLYCPALFPESMMAIITGREGFKFPKRFASVTLDERLAHLDAGDMRALVTWDEAVPRSDAAWVEDLAAAMLGDGPGTRIGSFLGAVWGRLGMRPAIKTHAPLPIYVRNRVGEENAGRATWVADELIWIPFDIEAAHSLSRLDGLSFNGFGRLAFARPIGGWEAVIDLRLKQGTAVHDLRRSPIARVRNAVLRARVRGRRLWSLLPI